ncbi:immunity 49 family protein [Myxococcus sp. AM001]|nr:immunity 49 family protein [Myxococcus sp. AM001]
MITERSSIHQRNAILENRDLVPHVIGGRVNFRGILAFCRNYRVVGISALFLTGTSERLHRELHRSGRAFLHYLKQAEKRELRTSRALPFFDAIGAGDFVGAAEIARHVRRSWARDEEYEEDFLFVEFLMQQFFLGADDASCEALLDRYERALQGAEDIRLELCQALFLAREDEFTFALNRFLADRDEHLRTVAEGQHVAPELLATEWNFSVEGLALLRLAERKRLLTEVEHLHVPSIARELPVLPVAHDAWMRPEEE